jgi:hypothetical protein
LTAAAVSSPGRKTWESLNRRNPQTGAPEGALAVRKAKFVRDLPVVGRRVIARDRRRHEVYTGYTSGNMENVKSLKEYRKDIKEEEVKRNVTVNEHTNKTGDNPTPPQTGSQTERPGFFRKTFGRGRGGRGGRGGGQPPESTT